MKKTTILVTLLCALCTGSLLAQTSCAGFNLEPDFDPSGPVYTDVHEDLRIYISQDPCAFFTALELPPGYSIDACASCCTNPVRILGEMATPGTYTFSIAATQNGCSDTLTFQRTYVESPTHVCEPIEISSDYLGQENFVGDSLHINYFVSNGEDPPFTFYPIDIRPGAYFDSLGHYKDYLPSPGTFTFKIGVRDAFGCTSTLTQSVFTMCNPVALWDQTLPTGKKGQYFEQQIQAAQEVHPPFSNFMASDPLPPGLSLSGSGVISGTPMQSGVFNFTVGYQGLGGCTGSTYVTAKFEDSVPIQSLWISPLCAQSLSVRNWVVHNPNAFSINVQWETVYFNTYQGTFVAIPGDNYFSSPDAGWPNSVRIKWYNQFLVQKSIVQGANDDLCTPLECLQVNGITFYHQGRQKDGNFVQAEFSNANAAMGPPDANDGANSNSKSFSLGYDGFITMKLSANLYDQPGNDLKVWENSLNNPDYGAYPERAEVFVSTDNANWISLGLTNPAADCHAKLDWEFDLAGKAVWCRFVKVVDVTFRHAKILDPVTCQQTSVLAFNNVSNGFDLDAITCVNNPAFAGRMASDESIDTTPSFTNNSEQNTVAYPNPATSWLTLDFSREPEFVYPEGGQIEVSIIDMNGKISTGGIHVLDDEWKTKVNLDRLSPGLFVAKVKAKGLSKYYKFSRN